MSLIGSGVLIAGQYHQYDVVLRAHMSHLIYVRPDRSNVDFDLQIYDGGGNLVQWDEAPDSDAMCRVTPLWTGTFSVMVICSAGASSYRVLIE
jgi:hypothetical protein